MAQAYPQEMCRRCGEQVGDNHTSCEICKSTLCYACADELSVDERCYCPGCHNLTPKKQKMNETTL